MQRNQVQTALVDPKPRKAIDIIRFKFISCGDNKISKNKAGLQALMIFYNITHDKFIA